MDLKCFLGTIGSVLMHDGVVECGTGELNKEEEETEAHKSETAQSSAKKETIAKDTEEREKGRRKKKILITGSGSYVGTSVEAWLRQWPEYYQVDTLDSYAPVKGEISRRLTGSLVAFETGETTAYGIGGVQDRGSMFIGPGVEVYAGMIVGQCNRNEDMAVNVCKKKQLTNMRAAGSDAAIRLVPPVVLSLEQCMEYLADDELLEVTPKSLRMRKRQLDHAARMRALMKSRQ